MSALSKKEAMAMGFEVYCESCKMAFKKVPLAKTEYGNKAHECPNCGGDIFFRIDNNQIPSRDQLE
jgi:rRNA maturation endonuclease Nob1